MTRVLADRPRTQASGQQGFSLIELLVAVAVSSIIMLVLITFVQSGAGIIATNDDILFSTNDAQAALDLIASDLRSIRPLNMPPSATSAPEVFQVYNDPEGVVTSKETIFPMQLMMLANSPGGQSEPHLIRYRVRYLDPVSGQPSSGANFPTFGLYREYISSDDSYGIAGSTTGMSTSATGGIAGITDQYNSYWKIVAPTSNFAVGSFLVNNIVDLQVLIYDTGSTTPLVALNTPSQQTTNPYVISNQSAPAGSGLYEGQTARFSSSGLLVPSLSANAIPYKSLVAEIKLTILTQVGANLYANTPLTLSSSLSNAISSNNSTGAQGKQVHIYIRRVPLQF